MLYSTTKKEAAHFHASGSDKASQLTSFDMNIAQFLVAVKECYPNELSNDVANSLMYKRGPSDIDSLRYSLEDGSFFDLFSGENDTSLSDTQFLEDGTEQTTDQRKASFDNAVSILEEGGRILYEQAMKDVDPAANERTTRQIARNILRDYQSDYDFSTLAGNLQKVFAYMQENETANYRDLMLLMTEIATPVLEQSRDTLVTSEDVTGDGS